MPLYHRAGDVVLQRHRAVSAVRWHLDDPRYHRRSPRDRQDPNPPRLARPGTAPIPRAVIRPTPKGLIPGRDPLSQPVQLPEPTASFGAHSRPSPKRPRSRATRTAEGPETSRILDRRIAPLTTRGYIRTLPLAEKGRLKFLYLIPLGALFWLLDVANAKTALVCSILGMVSIAVLTRTWLGRNPTAMFVGVVSLVVLAAVLESAFNIREIGIEALDRNPTLTDRTLVWEDVLAMPNNLLVGTGFESFWLGPRVEQLWQKYWWHPNQAHNGYIETYINLGAVGVSLLLIMIAAGFFRSLRTLGDGDAFGPVRFSLIVAIAIFTTARPSALEPEAYPQLETPVQKP